MDASSSVSSDQARHELEEPLSLMPQETYMNVDALQAQGWTIREIAEETGFHPATISEYLKGGPPVTAGLAVTVDDGAST
jgi:DNA-binding NarL/FixJ family response regulator